MYWLTKIIDLLLYGNFWIAAAAVAMSWQTELILTGRQWYGALSWFIFCATLCLYAAHRLIGMEKVAAFRDRGRFQIIVRYRRHILFYALLAAAGGAWAFFRLSAEVRWGIIPPALFSLAYVLPVFGRQRRLRDLHYIKIFLIAGVWAWVTVVLPALSLDLERNIPLWIMFGERLCFVFAITLPFDIRDLQVDAHARVRTLPALLGPAATRRLAAVALLLMLCLSFLNYRLEAYSTGVFLALLLSAALAWPLIYFSGRMKHDYYFSGLLDGLMVVQFAAVWLLYG